MASQILALLCLLLYGLELVSGDNKFDAFPWNNEYENRLDYLLDKMRSDISLEVTTPVLPTRLRNKNAMLAPAPRG